MQLAAQLEGEVLCISVGEDRLDAAVATAFKDQIRRTLAESQTDGDVILDLGQVDFMDSSGLGALIAVLKAMPHGRKLCLRRLRPNVERVLRLTRMDSVFRIEDGPLGAAGAA